MNWRSCPVSCSEIWSSWDLQLLSLRSLQDPPNSLNLNWRSNIFDLSCSKLKPVEPLASSLFIFASDSFTPTPSFALLSVLCYLQCSSNLVSSEKWKSFRLLPKHVRKNLFIRKNSLYPIRFCCCPHPLPAYLFLFLICSRWRFFLFRQLPLRRLTYVHICLQLSKVLLLWSVHAVLSTMYYICLLGSGSSS